jgi:hypothetical protein
MYASTLTGTSGHAPSSSIELQLRRMRFVYCAHSVLQSVQLNQMRLYELSINAEPVCSVDMDVPSWMPVRPRLSVVWLRSVVGQAVRGYYRRIAAQPK